MLEQQFNDCNMPVDRCSQQCSFTVGGLYVCVGPVRKQHCAYLNESSRRSIV